MVRRSSTTSRGTTYWFQYFCFPVSQLFRLHMRKFSELECLLSSRKKSNEGNEGNKKLDSRVYAAFALEMKATS